MSDCYCYILPDDELCTFCAKSHKQEVNTYIMRAMRNITNKISYKEGWAVATKTDNKGVYVQIECTNSTNADTQKPEPWKSGKRYLSEWMCEQEMVGVIFELIKCAEIHETHEFFRYKDVAIYSPHLDPDKLVYFATDLNNYCTRENAMSMEENNV